MALQDADGHVVVTLTDGTSVTGLWAPDGSTYVFDASAATDPVGLHHPCGAMNINIVDGSTVTGLQAPTGATNVVNDSSSTGIYNPCGALNVTGLV